MALTNLTQHSTESLGQNYKARNAIKCAQMRKEEIKLSCFADNMIIYIENPKASIKIPGISEFSEVARYKMNKHKLIVFLNTSKKKWKPELKTQNHLQTIQKVQHLTINITKHTENLYTRNHKTLMTEVKEALNKWRELLVCGLEHSHSKVSILSKLIYSIYQNGLIQVCENARKTFL